MEVFPRMSCGRMIYCRIDEMKLKKKEKEGKDGRSKKKKEKDTEL